jgi:hypothetical protein
MAGIIAARFETQAEADSALDALRALGVPAADTTCFYLNPPGQHAQYPIGGDAHHDEGTKHAGASAKAAAAIGSAAGLALGTATGAAFGEPGFTAAGAIAGAGLGGMSARWREASPARAAATRIARASTSLSSVRAA